MKIKIHTIFYTLFACQSLVMYLLFHGWNITYPDPQAQVAQEHPAPKTAKQQQVADVFDQAAALNKK